MKKCDRCGKPLTEFEIAFHREAASPPAISGTCWSCCGGEEQFMNGYADKPHHRVEILVCLLAVAVVVALLIPLFPYLNVYELPESLAFYSYVAIVAYTVMGVIVTRIIRRQKGNLPKVQEWDPPTTRYQNIYGPNTDIYKTRINRDGDLVTTKETRLGGRIDDRWAAHASSGSAAVDGVIDFYKKLIKICFVPCFYLLAGISFFAWVLPYILVMLVRDGYAGSRNKEIPVALQRAYRRCRKAYGDFPITYDDKVGFLVCREDHKSKRSENTNSFLSHYKQSDVDDSAPFFCVRKKGVSYMIVDYRRDANKSYGVTFLLVDDGSGSIRRRIGVGNGFLPEGSDWEHEWNEAGISLYAKKHLDWYEHQLKHSR